MKLTFRRFRLHYYPVQSARVGVADTHTLGGMEVGQTHRERAGMSTSTKGYFSIADGKTGH